MQIRSCPRWLRIVSTRIAVLPVVRSPMISSRWPRPIGIIESIAFSPVCTGSFTGRGRVPSRCLVLERPPPLRLDRAGPVDGLAERVDDPADQLRPDGNARDL